MDRINHASAEADKFGAGKDGFTDGDPVDPSSGTIINEDFLDGVQEELIGLIEAAGNTPSNADYTQLQDVLMAIVSGTGGYKATEGLFFSTLADTEPRIIDFGSPIYDRYVIAEFGPGTERIMVYFSGISLDISYNCYYSDVTGWISTGSNPRMMTISPSSGVIQFNKTLVSNSFTEQFTIDSTRSAPGTAEAGYLHPAALTKAIGYVSILSGGTATMNSGSVNFTSTVGKEVGGAVSMNFQTPFADTSYIAQVTSRYSTVGSRRMYVNNATTSQVRVTTYDSSGTLVDPTTDTIQFNITVCGAQ